MAYQMPGPMGNGSPAGNMEQLSHQPPGTEYTLQGVMRFLQMEWHSHERARNSWDIERAEMKAKIAKQEGEIRHNKRLHDQLDRQVRMLESVLKKERAKSHGPETITDSSPTVNGVPVEIKNTEVKQQDKTHRPSMGTTHNSFMDLGEAGSIEELERGRDKSKKYLDRCLEEVQYLLAPPPHPVPAQTPAPNGAYTGLTDPPPSFEDAYSRNVQHNQSQFANTHLANNHHSNDSRSREVPPPAKRQANERSYMPSQGAFSQHVPRSTEVLLDDATQSPSVQLQPPEENVEVITHTFDECGRSIPSQEQLAPHRTAEEDADGWNFEEQQALVMDDQTESQLPRRRPDTDMFPNATDPPIKTLSPRRSLGSGRRRSSGSSGGPRRRNSGSAETHDSGVDVSNKLDPMIFKVRFALRGHLDVVRSIVSTGGGSPSEPEICTAGDDGTIKRWIVPASYGNALQNGQAMIDLDIACYFTHRGHEGIITSLAACPTTNFSTGGRAAGDGWIFSGGQDATVRVWERGRVDPKAILEGHTDAVWTVCVLPGNTTSVFGSDSVKHGGPDRIVVASGSADGTVKVWTVSAPPQWSSAPQAGSRRGVGGSRRHSVTSGSNHPNSPQPNIATATPLHYTLVHTIARPTGCEATPTSISPLNPTGENFVVSYTDSSILIFDTRTGEEIIGMASNETYDGTMATSINSVVATSTAPRTVVAADGSQTWADMTDQDESLGAGPTGSVNGVEGVIVSGHEDRYIRFFDANSGQCTYTMLAHPSAISSLSLSPDGHEAVSAGHDASIRFWSLDKRICTQEITCHRPMRGEGVCSVVWSQDGRYVVSGGGDGIVKVFAR